MTVVRGACRCGAVRLSVDGEPLRVGICHCTDCRQESGSAFTFYGIWPAAALASTGETAAFAGRRFCPACGSRLFAIEGDEAEVRLGCLEGAPTALKPSYELWTRRREAWLPPLDGARQFDGDRT